MSVLARNESESKENILFIKGAPDYLLERTDKIMNTTGDIVTLNKENLY